MEELLNVQLAKDFCCTPEQVISRENIFTIYRKLEGRRRFQEQEECFLKIACVHNKLLVTGQKEIVEWCENKYRDTNAAWFMEQSALRELEAQLNIYGYQIGSAHPFYIADVRKPRNDDLSKDQSNSYEITWYYDDEIEQFRGDDRFGEAFAFCSDAPDRIGVSAERDGVILGMAGASSDSERMWQIGINVMPEARGNQLGVRLVALLRDKLLQNGILPFYGTAMSHIVSQRVAVRSGFVPAWAELYAEKKKKQEKDSLMPG